MDEAAAHYLRATRWRVDADLLNGLAVVVTRQGKLDEATALLGQALELKPNFAMAVANLGDRARATR